MNKRELAFIKAIEECSEVTHRISKLLRFGEQQIQDEHKTNNFDRVQEEYFDLLYIMEMLGFKKIMTEGQYILRDERYKKYLERSRNLGRLAE
jgi:hypothetical protein